MDIRRLPAFPLSSTRVRSVGVSDPVLSSREFLESQAPVYIIGSGKSAMDCVQHIAQRSARRRSVGIVLGSGMWFLSRDHLFPTGPWRFTRGALVGEVFLRICELFDGQNERELMRAPQREKIAIHVFGEGDNCRYGMLSFTERDQSLGAVNEIHRGHLVDVEGTSMTLREGNTLRTGPVAAGSWFINRMTHLQHLDHEPVLQDSGLVRAPQYALGFTGATAYYPTHLWYRDELPAVASELFRLRVDVEPKLRFMPHLSLMVLANLAMAAARLPRAIPANFQGDTNRWYPAYRQLLLLTRILVNHKHLQRKAEKLLQLRFSNSPEAVLRA